jgi:hypothetical protein
MAATMSKPPSVHALLGRAAGTETDRYTRVLDAVLIVGADQVATAAQGY